jgi:MoaA/NifB/PqqE/SkfB family radical SAM enzyme
VKRTYLLAALKPLIKVKLLGQRIPLAVGWALTYRCNRQCVYCGSWKNEWPELSTAEIVKLADELKRLGTRWISFSGGEPLLRTDLGDIIKYMKNLKIYLSLNTNGSLVPKRIEDLDGVNMIKLSLDGPEQVHDSMRGNGSFKEVMEALKVCRQRHIPVSLECVLSKYNLDRISYLLEIAIENRAHVHFQPATATLLRSEEVNPAVAPASKYREAIIRLIELKKRGLPIYNSVAGLKHLYFWPDLRVLKCSAGRLSLRIEPNGTIIACDRVFTAIPGKENKEISINTQISRMMTIKNCRCCCCSSLVEFNLLCSLNVSAVLNYLNYENSIC